MPSSSSSSDSDGHRHVQRLHPVSGALSTAIWLNLRNPKQNMWTGMDVMRCYMAPKYDWYIYYSFQMLRANGPRKHGMLDVLIKRIDSIRIEQVGVQRIQVHRIWKLKRGKEGRWVEECVFAELVGEGRVMVIIVVVIAESVVQNILGSRCGGRIGCQFHVRITKSIAVLCCIAWISTQIVHWHWRRE